jgi:hypothetical protein
MIKRCTECEKHVKHLCINITHINAIREFTEKQFLTGEGVREKSFQKLKVKSKSGLNGKYNTGENQHFNIQDAGFLCPLNFNI